MLLEAFRQLQIELFGAVVDPEMNNFTSPQNGAKIYKNKDGSYTAEFPVDWLKIEKG